MSSVSRTLRQLRRAAILLQLCWLAVVVASCLWSLWNEKQEVYRLASLAARTSLDKDVLFRRWAARLGGIYVPVTPSTPPNPYLAQIPERDLVTPSGRRLTLMNPAYMTRQVHALARKTDGVQGHITSLNPLNPHNAPDPWERRALEAFARGEQEVVAEATIDGAPYLRLMRRLVVGKECLKCHAAQGYHEGDIRGGLSVAVPLGPYYAATAGHRRMMVAVHALLWLMGAAVFCFGYAKLRRGVAEQNHAEQALEQAALEWAAAMDATDDPIYLLDVNRRIIRANQAFARMAGSEPAAVIGRHIESVVHPEGETMPCPVCEAQNKLRDAVIIMEADDPFNPAGRPIQITVKIVRGENGQRPVSILMTLHDLTRSRHELEEKARLETMLRQAQKMEALGTLAGGIAHDFNNILSPIFGFTEMALSGLPADAAAGSDLKQVLIAAKRARELVQQILTFSRQGEQELRPLRLQLVIKESLKLLRASIPTSIAIREEIDPGCEPVLADPTQIQQVTMNLCTNAYHAMREKGGLLTVRLQMVELAAGDLASKNLAAPGRYILLTVADTGIGMFPEIQERIFDPYFTTKKMGEGTGLGLAMVHGIVRGLHGGITVASAPGRGAAFHIYLPAVAAAAPAEEEAAPAPLPAGSERVLLVDDDPMTLAALRSLLQNLGYRAEPFGDAAEAVAAFRERPRDFDLVLTDMTMPGKTGEDVARELLVLRPGLPVILCTGFS
ncbi:MAG: DUF3365 domain-containing protein, partial [Desulfobacteraceae bacterium]|nr:DUF3365 domain-containing protein [Desulfobacteraceae bacterium]